MFLDGAYHPEWQCGSGEDIAAIVRSDQRVYEIKAPLQVNFFRSGEAQQTSQDQCSSRVARHDAWETRIQKHSMLPIDRGGLGDRKYVQRRGK